MMDVKKQPKSGKFEMLLTLLGRDEASIELERKKASHIMHYLMERRQEQDYSDPFDLL